MWWTQNQIHVYKTTQMIKGHQSRGVIWGGGGGMGAVAPPPPKEKEKRKKKKKEKKERKKKERRELWITSNYYIQSAVFFQFFNSPVALKNIKKFWPPKKKLKWRPCTNHGNLVLEVFIYIRESWYTTRFQLVGETEHKFFWKYHQGSLKNSTWMVVGTEGRDDGDGESV